MRQRHLFLILVILTFLAAMAVSGVSAFQQSGQSTQTTQTPPKEQEKEQEKDPVPVAITPRIKPAATPINKEVAEDEFATFGFPSINNKGAVAFLGRFILPSGSERSSQSIFVREPDGTWHITRRRDKTLNDGWVITDFNNPVINDNGDLAFSGNFADPTVALQPVSTHAALQADGAKPTANAGIFIKTSAGIRNLVQLGEEVPRMPSKFTGFSNPSANSKGTLAFIGTYGDPDGRGLFIMEEGKLTLVVRSGQKISPEDPSVFSEHYYPSQINERGEIAWFSRIGGTSGGGIFVKRATGVEAIALQGNPAPLKPPKPTAVKKATGARGKTAASPAKTSASGARSSQAKAPVKVPSYIGFGQISPSINDKGDVAFVAFYDGPEAGRALFLKEGDAPVKVVAKSGDKITDTTYNFTSFDKPAINNRGEIAFIGSYGGRTRGVFLKTAKGIEIIALAEQKVPDGDKDELFNNFVQPALNDRGEVVFYAQLKNGLVGIFIKDASGLKRLAVRGDKMPVQFQ